MTDRHDGSSAREVAAYLVALRPILSSATEARRTWVKRIGALMEDARNGNGAQLARSAASTDQLSSALPVVLVLDGTMGDTGPMIHIQKRLDNAQCVVTSHILALIADDDSSLQGGEGRHDQDSIPWPQRRQERRTR